jgi:pseudouridine-5'-phosphate glycosidase
MMVLDDCYVPFLRRANLLAVANIIAHGMPVFNATSIMAMVDRWRRHDGAVR